MHPIVFLFMILGAIIAATLAATLAAPKNRRVVGWAFAMLSRGAPRPGRSIVVS